MNQAELPFIRKMFDRIAPHYDALNRLLSARQDVRWRRELASRLDLKPTERILDVACGTGDVALEINRLGGGTLRVVGVDFAVGMLRLARSKIHASRSDGAIALAAADALALPFAPESFDAVTIAFGIRNISNKAAALDSFHSRLKPGGRLAVLELTTPQSGVLRALYLFYFKRLLPLVGRFVSRHKFAYTYLPDSVAHFPSPENFAAMIRQAGFTNIRYRQLTGGVATLFLARKPAQRLKTSQSEEAS